MQSVNQFLQDLSLNARADLDTVDGSTTSLTARVAALESATLSIKYTTGDYTILDDDGYDIVMVDSRGGNVTITLPTLAANQSRQITVIAQYLGGQITVDGEGAETVDGIAASVLQSKDDFVTVLGTTTEWKILSCKQVLSTGWINTNDWTNRHLGSINLGYDNLTGTFTVGEVVNEYSDSALTTATGVSGIIISDSGSVLVLKNAVKGTFTNNYYLKGATSAATADVNVATKNVDCNIYHGMSRDSCDLSFMMWYSPTGVENGAVNMVIGQGNYVNDGASLYQISTNEVKVQTGAKGYKIISDVGFEEAIDTEDSYYRIVIKYVK